MIIIGMDHFQNVCKNELVKWYNSQEDRPTLQMTDMYIVWSCKTLQNYKCLASTTYSDGIYVEFTYNGDKQELYMDVYRKVSNTVIK